MNHQTAGDPRRPGCKRCGICCRASTPALYDQDLPLVQRGVVSRGSLMTLRAGEMVHSNRLGSSFMLDHEIVQIRHVPDRGCVMLLGDECRIHPDHPLQCRHLECWSHRNASELEHLPRLQRKTLFAEDELACRLIDEFEVKVPAGQLSRLLLSVSRGSRAPIPEVLELMDRDHRLRLGIAAHHGYDMDIQLLLLGRPAVAVARAHGLELVLGEGRPTLQVTRTGI